MPTADCSIGLFIWLKRRIRPTSYRRGSSIIDAAIAGARCAQHLPYCAADCGTLISVKQDEAGKDRMINIEAASCAHRDQQLCAEYQKSIKIILLQTSTISPPKVVLQSNVGGSFVV
jgi:hypothetical protein